MSRHLSELNRPSIVCGRKNCGRCGRWQVGIFYQADKRDDKGEVLYLHSWCDFCSHKSNREVYHSSTPRQRERRRKSRRASWRRGKSKGKKLQKPIVDNRNIRRGQVDRVPFARWLKQKISESNTRIVSERTGLNQKYIFSVVKGYSRHGRAKSGKRTLMPVDTIDLHTVDKALMLYGESPSVLEDMYPTK